MAKKSVEQAKQPFLKRLWNSKLFLPILLASIVVIVFSLLAFGISTGKSSNALETTYGKLAIPSHWQRVSIERQSMPSCAFSDVTCPDIYASYDISGDANQLSKDLQDIRSSLAKSSYNFRKACYVKTSQCDVPGIDADNGEVRVTVWVATDNNPLKSYVEIQKIQ